MWEDRDRLVMLIIILSVIIVLAFAVISALMVAWRNYNRRDHLLDKGRKLRAQFRGERPERARDVWKEAARRYGKDAGGASDADVAPPDDDDHDADEPPPQSRR